MQIVTLVVGKIDFLKKLINCERSKFRYKITEKMFLGGKGLKVKFYIFITFSLTLYEKFPYTFFKRCFFSEPTLMNKTPETLHKKAHKYIIFVAIRKK